MKPFDIFADTSGLLPFLVPALPEHSGVSAVVRDHLQRGGRFITTNYVLAELLALMNSRTRLSRPQTLRAIDSIQLSSRFEIVHITPELHRRAFELLLARPDKEWSWVDAASFVVMQERAVSQALTTDHHFDQAGFVRLLA